VITLELIYLLVILSFIPLVPWRLSKLLEENPHLFEGVAGEKKAKKMFKFYSIVSVLILVGSAIWQPDQIFSIAINCGWLLLISLGVSYGLTHRPELNLVIEKIKNLKWGK
jgi:hypothetical protein